MTEITCEIRNTIFIDSTEFYKVYDLKDNEEHLIPANQINGLIDLKNGNIYNFIKEQNRTNSKYFLSLVNPNYKIGYEYSFTVKEIINNETGSYFVLECPFNFNLSVRVLHGQTSLTTVKCKVMGYKRGLPVLRNIDLSNSEWEINKSIKFEVFGFGSISNNKGELINTVIIKTIDDVKIHVRANKWHTETKWHFKDLSCKIIGICRDGLPKLMIDDDRHPYYETGNIYNFKILKFSDRTTTLTQSHITVIELIDKYEDKYEVFALINQINTLKGGDIINCKIEKIGTQLNLKQVYVDPFFSSYEEIVNDKNKLENFDKYLNNSNDLNSKLYSQYISKSAFWVFTYCNNIIPKIKSDLANRKEYKGLLEINNLHTVIEEWIISSGILRAIFNEDERKATKRKIEHVLENNRAEKKIIRIITNYEINDFLYKQMEGIDLRELYYFVRYCDMDLVDEFIFLKIITNLTSETSFDTNELYYLRLILKSLSIAKYKNRLNVSIDYFILSASHSEINKKSISKYFTWSCVIIHFYEILNQNKQRNLQISQLYRLFSSLEGNYDDRKKLLFNSFFILSKPDVFYPFPILMNDNFIDLDIANLPANPNYTNFSLDVKSDYYRSTITDRNFLGFKINIDNVEGFLSFNNVVDADLKYNQLSYLGWESNVEIILNSTEFNYFIAKQLPINSDNYYSEKKIDIKIPDIGTIIFGTVKNLQNYGVFFSTEFGDGLLRINNISEYFVHQDNIPIYFKIGDKIPLYLLDNEDGKLELSFKHLIGTEFEDFYFDTMEFYEFDLENSAEDEKYSEDFMIEVEKGFVFEKYAILQNVITEKIKYLKFAKAFFSNTKNARSYLLNIYIEYFNSLLKLDEILSDYSVEKYEEFKKYIIQIKDKVQPKTLENYPESKNLLFFIEILNLFNSKEEKDLDTLFLFVKKPVNDNESLFKVVSKTVLSNNLIISESNYYNHKDLDSYTLKNLKRIRTYISQGVLSLEDTLEDKLSMELEQKRIYWKKMIEQDEGEKLEFKSTLLTPVPDLQKREIILALEKQLEKEQDIIASSAINNRIDEINGLTAQKRIIHSALKTISAFANTNGGTLLLGVSDDKKIYGLEQDYKSFKKENSRDEFGKRFDDIIKEYFGNSFSSTLLEKEFLKFPEGDILIITVKTSEEEIFILKDEDGKKQEDLYVRNLSSSEKLHGAELAKFIKKKYRQSFINNINIIE